MSMLNIATSGLTASQLALNVASNNIANVNTPGYSRQAAQLQSQVGGGNLDNGRGVAVGSVRRLADGYLTAQLWRSGSESGFHRTQSQYLETVEQMFGSDALSITAGLDKFFAGLSAAAESPETLAPRQQIISSAAALASRFNQLASNLDNQGQQLTDQLGASVGQVNSYLQRIGELNQRITHLAAGGGNTSQLEDQRDQAIRALTELVDVKVSQQADGSLNLTLAQGQPLVMGHQAATLEVQGEALTLSCAGLDFPVAAGLRGSLGGLLAYRQTVLEPAREQLDAMASLLADEFNTQQAAGYDINTPRGAGQPLFAWDPANPAGSLQVAAGFQAEDLALGSAALGPGDNSNLLAMLNLKDEHYDAYTSLLGKLAVQSGQAKADLAASEQLAQQIEGKVNSVSGVNLDEEGVSIMQFSQAYQANAKVISAADELFTTLLGMF